tara:strand:+ start:40 stop:783 length:744 start_codon:yes stop_codon:yes gene_type:complete
MENVKKRKNPIDYSKSKIYKIVCDTTGLIYIGSTVETLCRRLSGHRSDYKRYLKGKYSFLTSFDILKNDNYKIILIENCPCNSKEELHREERKYIESIECVNKNIPTRTDKEYREINKDKMKEYYEINKDKIKEYHKEYYEDNQDNYKEYKKKNRDKIKEYKKQYSKDNKEKVKEYKKKNRDKIKEYIKQYRENNKDKLKEIRKKYIEKNKDKIKEKIECEFCRSTITKNHIKRHQQSLKCKKFQSN